MVMLRPALACAFALAAVSAHGAPDHAGRYDNLRYIDEADDYVGARLTVKTGRRPTVDFELCEGWCNGSQVFPAKIEGDRLSFTYVIQSVDQNGRPSPSSLPVTGRFVRGGLILKIGDEKPEKLRKLPAIPR